MDKKEAETWSFSAAIPNESGKKHTYERSQILHTYYQQVKEELSLFSITPEVIVCTTPFLSGEEVVKAFFHSLDIFPSLTFILQVNSLISLPQTMSRFLLTLNNVFSCNSNQIFVSKLPN